MEVSHTSELLRRTLDPAARPEAESELNSMQKIIGFSPLLLQVIMNESVEAPVRQAAAIFFKNHVNRHWANNPDYDPRTDGPVVPFSIHEQDRAMVRDNIIEALVRANPEPLRLQLGICVSIIIKHDYPGHWTQVVDKISIFLQNQEPSGWPGSLLAMYHLVKNYEYKKKEDRGPLIDAMKLLLPQAYNLSIQCQGSVSQTATEIRKQILKIFYALTQYTLPLEILDRETFTKWMEVCNTAILASIPPSANDVDKDERPSLIWWKEKKWSLHILTRIFERYGSPGNVVSEYKEFSEWYIRTFSSGVLDSIFKILAAVSNHEAYVSPRVIQQALNYVNIGVAHALTWKLIKPHTGVLVKDVIFPLMCYTQDDDELWQTDPYEYIRLKFDIFEDFVSPVTAAQTLLHSICKKRKHTLPQTMELLLKVLQSQETSTSQKDGALHMIGTLADILLKKKDYKGQMEDFLSHIVLPQFHNPNGHMRARACWVLHYFADLNFKNQDVLMNAFRVTTDSLLKTNEEVPVKVEAAIALQMLLSTQEEAARPIVEPQIGDIALSLLNIIRETENDDLTTVMQKIVCTYTDKLVPLAVKICNHLVETFAQVVDSGDNGDDKAITAMGLLNTMETILSVMESRQDVHSALEPIVLQAVHHIFSNSIIEFYEEGLNIASNLTTNKISSNMWELLGLVYDVFLKDGQDYFIDMMPLLHNYVTVNFEQFLSNPAYITVMYEMAKKMLESEPGEDPECHAAKLLEVIIIQGKGKNIDAFVTTAIKLSLNRLGREIKTSELRTMCLQVAISALFYDPNLFFSTLQTLGSDTIKGNAVIARFVDQWLNDTDCFIGLHDRKLCIIGLCCLLSTPNIPGVTENASRFLPTLIMLFEGLKRAYENQNESSSEEESSDDDEESDEGILQSDEDEIDDKAIMYLENLQKKILAVPGDIKIETSIEDTLSPKEDDDDSDIYEETSLENYSTLIDDEAFGVDEYEIFKSVMQDIEANKKDWYHILTATLSIEDQTKIGGVLTLCAQRKAMRESKSIEKAGGYSFSQQSVPNQFQFISDTKGFSFGK